MRTKQINLIIEGLSKEHGIMEAQVDKKELDILLNLVDSLNEELKTEVYTLKPAQRNVVNTLTKGHRTRQKMVEGYNQTLKEGFFNAGFNTDSTAKEFIKDLEFTLGVKGRFYLERVALNGGDKKVIPGFQFMGYPVKGVIIENRLFKK